MLVVSLDRPLDYAGNLALADWLAPLWEALNDAATELNREAGDPLEAIDRLEGAVARRSLYDRVLEKRSPAPGRNPPAKTGWGIAGDLAMRKQAARFISTRKPPASGLRVAAAAPVCSIPPRGGDRTGDAR